MTSIRHTISIEQIELFLIPIQMRMPLKFGDQVLNSVTCARVKVTVVDEAGRSAVGYGETPLSVGWVWPSSVDYEMREQTLIEFTQRVADDLLACSLSGHPMEIGFDYLTSGLGQLRSRFNEMQAPEFAVPHLASLVCFSPFDIAVHDAYGNLLERPTYQCYDADCLNRDLADFFEGDANFLGRSPADYLDEPKWKLPVWHLVGGLDPLETGDLTGDEPDDGYPVLLRDWIQRDGLDCLKVKLRGNDDDWDFNRLRAIGDICCQENVTWLTADFNCTVTNPDYVNQILDRLRDEHAVTYQKILYVEQPFPHDLEANQIDVSSVSARKPLFMDESAHDWQLVRLGKQLGWSGVALKTCKTQTGALLSLCWAKANGMTLMVQDLTNPMLAQIPHFLLAAHAGTIMGIESNAMQFYPEASAPEREVHQGLYRREGGVLDGTTLGTTGFGYRIDEINRELP
ncbi:MAG: mandelate racemase/muconate lactonizing enzyme family protein [Planctomycetota bacterium]